MEMPKLDSAGCSITTELSLLLLALKLLLPLKSATALSFKQGGGDLTARARVDGEKICR